MKYIFAIDETGKFDIYKKKDPDQKPKKNNDDISFVCGVLVKGNEEDLKLVYQQMYKEFGYPEPTSTDEREILNKFHYTDLKKTQKIKEIETCKNYLLPFVSDIYISKGKPLLSANNQSWWLTAVTVVIKDFLNKIEPKEDDEIDIFIDNRASCVLGMREGFFNEKNDTNDLFTQNVCPTCKQKIDKESQIDTKDWLEYHKKIRYQIANIVKDYVANGVKLKIIFNSDKSNFFINLADIVCGLVRSNKENESLEGIPIKMCLCKNLYEGNVNTYRKTEPLFALNLILQEASEDNFRNEEYVQEIISSLRNDKTDFTFAWNMFYEFVKSEINERESGSSLARKRNFVSIFLEEFRKKETKENLSPSDYIETMVLFVEYFSHIGSVDLPFEHKYFVEQLRKVDGKGAETRILRKWEKMVSYTLRESEICFNAYNFLEIVDNVNHVLERHEKILELLSCDGLLSAKDENTTALNGVLGQAYALDGNIDKAIECFEKSIKYAIKSGNRTYSYLFYIYHKQKNIEKCREYFELSCGKTPEKYYEEEKYDNEWNLFLYCKLRALELYVNGSTTLPSIDLTILKNYNTEYPFPLVMKWEGIALWLEDKEINKNIVEQYFVSAVDNLFNPNNDFTIRTLALPIIQCHALITNQNTYSIKYRNELEELMGVSKYFEAFVSKTPILKSIENSGDIWERAMSLPFYYA